jgi:hypothetical protein
LESRRTAAAGVCVGEASAEGRQASLSLIEGGSLNEKRCGQKQMAEIVTVARLRG